jgi:hypothetical protein
MKKKANRPARNIAAMEASSSPACGRPVEPLHSIVVTDKRVSTQHQAPTGAANLIVGIGRLTLPHRGGHNRTVDL